MEDSILLQHEIDTLILLVEVIVAFVAFSSIVASVKMTMGKAVTPHQQLLVHFFTESGMLAASVCLLPLVLLGFIEDIVLLTRLTCAYTLVAVSLYLAWYLRRRFRIKAPTPLGSAFVIIGWVIWVPILLTTAAGKIWAQDLAVIVALGFWSISGSTIIFVTFLATFVDDASVELEGKGTTHLAS